MFVSSNKLKQLLQENICLKSPRLRAWHCSETQDCSWWDKEEPSQLRAQVQMETQSSLHRLVGLQTGCLKSHFRVGKKSEPTIRKRRMEGIQRLSRSHTRKVWYTASRGQRPCDVCKRLFTPYAEMTLLHKQMSSVRYILQWTNWLNLHEIGKKIEKLSPCGL